MKITVNEIICSTEEEIKEALKWENQKGEYATIEYHETTPIFGAASGTICGLSYNDKDYNRTPQQYTMRNWYNDNEECTTPYDGNDPRLEGARFYSKKLSYEYNAKEILKEIRKDLKEIKAALVPSFEIISKEYDAVRANGYDLDETDDRHHNFSLWHLGRNDQYDELDYFCDRVGNYLCKDETGTLYAVSYIYSGKTEQYEPMIWQKVRKA